MKKLEIILEYQFQDRKLLERALTHPSLSLEEDGEHYERLEFLGDSVLNLLVSEFLMSEFPLEKEGELAKRRSVLVCGKMLTQIASDIELGQNIIMSEGEEISGGRENASNLENCMEAIIGAVYLDGGLSSAKAIIEKFWYPVAESMTEIPQDPKTYLQEWAQKRGKPIPNYRVISSEGPAHAPEFVVEVNVIGFDPFIGKGSSKKIAEREAAKNLIREIEYNEQS